MRRDLRDRLRRSIGRFGKRGARAPREISFNFALELMLHYFKFRQELAAPVAGQDVYIKRGAGRGWPEECPPIRAANAFGFDLLANFDVTFIRNRAGDWRVEDDIVI